MAGGAGGGILIFEEGWLAGVFAAGCFGLKKSRIDAFLDIFDVANGRNRRSGVNFQFLSCYGTVQDDPSMRLKM
jgi:hypothetical protein